MKAILENKAFVIIIALLLAGCAARQQVRKHSISPAPTSARNKAESGKVLSYFPSGQLEGSGLVLEKMMPTNVSVGQHYQYSYIVSNLTQVTLENVQVNDRVSGDFFATHYNPQPASFANGTASWNLGSIRPHESKTITVSGHNSAEGVAATSVSAGYNYTTAQDLHIRKADISLTKSEPADVVICDPIPVTLTVKNTGSNSLSAVQVADRLATGLTSQGKTNLIFEIGDLAPGKSKSVDYIATASSIGRFVSTANITSSQGFSAEASAITTVHQPVLEIACKIPEQQYIDHNFDVSYTITNTGDTPAAETRFELAIPTGVTIGQVTGKGQINDKNIEWELGSVAAGSSQTVGATLSSSEMKSVNISGTAKGACAAAITKVCSTRIVGIPATSMEKTCDPNPVAVGENTTYTVKVKNSGSGDDLNVQVVITLAPQLVPVSTSEGSIEGQTVTMPILDTLPVKQVTTYKIIAKGVTAGEGRTQFRLSSASLAPPVTQEQSTTVY